MAGKVNRTRDFIMKILTLLGLIAVFPAALWAQNEDAHPYTKANISPVGFEYKDDATDGCWTNAGDSAELARAALAAAGLDVAGDGEAPRTVLYLYVDAQRDGGGCYGNMLLDLRGPSVWAETPVRVILRDSGANFIGQPNVNGIIPLILSHFVGGELAGFPDE